MNAVAYYRCSGQGQENGDTFKRQAAVVTRFAAEQGIGLIDDYREEGVSGTDDHAARPKFSEMLERLAGNCCRTIIVEHADRLARDVVVQELLLREMEQLGVAVLDASSGQNLADSSEPTRVMIRQILAAIAQCDKSRIVQKLRVARDRKSCARGHRLEGPVSYARRAGGLGLLVEISLLRRLGCTWAEVALSLAAAAVPTRNGRAWDASTARKLWQRNTL